MLKKLFLKYPEKNNFLIALSGGVDSIVLLFQLLKWKEKYNFINIRAIHINHNLNKNSKIAEKHCIYICKKYNIPIITKSISYPIKNKYGIEQYFRIKRYEIFKKKIQKNEVLLTAHHLNDQCENIFLALKRRQGISGISGIEFSKKINNITIIRPLIYHTKKIILNWAKINNLKWIEDISNNEIKFDRNFIRNIILPKICQRWPYFLKNCTNSMNILSGEKKILNFLIKKYLYRNTYIDGRLSLINFTKISYELKYFLIKLWIFKQSKIFPNFKLLNRIYAEILENNNTYTKKIIFKKYVIYKYKISMYCILYIPPIKNKVYLWKNPFFPIKLPNNLGFLIAVYNKKIGISIPCPEKNTKIYIKFQNNEKKIKNSNNKNKKIKKIWQENNIPPWYRNKIPLLFYNKILTCIPGIFTLKNNNKKKSLNIVWIDKI